MPHSGKILIISATFPEIEPLVRSLNAVPIRRNYYRAVLNKKEVNILITGVGMINTTFYSTKTLLSEPYTLVINLGIAGSFNRQIIPGDLVNVVSDTFPEMGAENHNEFLTLEELNLRKDPEFPFQNGFITNNYSFPYTCLKPLPKVKGLTVNTVHGNENSIQQLIELYPADTESMEGAAVFYTCMMERVPFMQIRAISNFVEPRNRKAWKIGLAIENLNTFALKLITEIIATKN